MTTRPTVLIVDDRREYVDALARILRSDFNVMTANSVQAAEKCFVEINQDIILALVDICLNDTENPADRSGLKLIEWIHKQSPSTTVVGMSALDDRLLPEEVLRLGAYRFLRKPVRIEDLRGIISELTNSRSTE